MGGRFQGLSPVRARLVRVRGRGALVFQIRVRIEAPRMPARAFAKQLPGSATWAAPVWGGGGGGGGGRGLIQHTWT
jgi:hypothetical protein